MTQHAAPLPSAVMPETQDSDEALELGAGDALLIVLR
jgi:hypothetical protein